MAGKFLNERENMYDQFIDDAGRHHGVPPELIKACIRQESSFSDLAVRKEPHIRDESRGLMQILTSTAKSIDFDPDRLFEPRYNIECGTRYLAIMHSHFGEIPLYWERWRFAVASYNAGRGNINKTLEMARRSLGIQHKTPLIEAKATPNLPWTEWWYASRFLPSVTGKSSRYTLHHIENVWDYIGEYTERGHFRD